MIHLECSLEDYIPIHTHGSEIEQKLFKISWMGYLEFNRDISPHTFAVVLIKQL